MRWVSTRVLPEPGAGQDQQRALRVQDGLTLGVVQTLEKAVRLGHGAHPIEDKTAPGALSAPASPGAAPGRGGPGSRAPRPRPRPSPTAGGAARAGSGGPRRSVSTRSPGPAPRPSTTGAAPEPSPSRRALRRGSRIRPAAAQRIEQRARTRRPRRSTRPSELRTRSDAPIANGASCGAGLAAGSATGGSFGGPGRPGGSSGGGSSQAAASAGRPERNSRVARAPASALAAFAASGPLLCQGAVTATCWVTRASRSSPADRRHIPHRLAVHRGAGGVGQAAVEHHPRLPVEGEARDTGLVGAPGQHREPPGGVAVEVVVVRAAARPRGPSSRPSARCTSRRPTSGSSARGRRPPPPVGPVALVALAAAISASRSARSTSLALVDLEGARVSGVDVRAVLALVEVPRRVEPSGSDTSSSVSTFR